ncbi:hypothetical protein [Paracoccus sp. PAR01]|uniref:hypothetical protein n=1 Tax=Paracoccus sp. PAR01 TaxID=2769282 RepID=UPI001785EF06|nr:hypothetical protein [Paracoccus sp. PAR01]MBD9525625.1 hypothetical protein [Paracoccus sp. PAR01]
MEAIREELTTAELRTVAHQGATVPRPVGDDPREPFNDIHPTMISGWKRTATENMSAAFGYVSPPAPQLSEKEVEKLHARIGQLGIERDLLSAAPSLILGTGGKRR